MVGPSGAGKDSLINHAACHFGKAPRLRFVRRIITRPRDGATEDHQSMTQLAFRQLDTDGGFAVSWAAHGLHYGIPRDNLDFVGNGGIAICNGSRSALPLFVKAFGKVQVVNVTASPDILAARLEARGRETREDILERLARSTMDVRGDFDVVEIDNSGALATAGSHLIRIIETALASVPGRS